MARVGGARVHEHADELVQLPRRQRGRMVGGANASRAVVSANACRAGGRRTGSGSARHPGSVDFSTNASAVVGRPRDGRVGGGRLRGGRGGDAFGRVRPHVDGERELEVVVQLHLAHRLEVEFESLEVDEEHGRQLAHACALQGLNVLAALALELVVAVEHLALDIRGEPVQDRLLALDVDRERVKDLVFVGKHAPVLTHNLVDERAAEEGGQQLGGGRVFQSALELLDELVVELVHVHLDRGVDGQRVVVAPRGA